MRFAQRLRRGSRPAGAGCVSGSIPGRVRGEWREVRGVSRGKVIDETAEHAAAFKPNAAYFEAMGSDGVALLERVIESIPDGIPMILDAKRSDIGETQSYYAEACFGSGRVDAVTLNPFLGYDSLRAVPRLGGARRLPACGDFECRIAGSPAPAAGGRAGCVRAGHRARRAGAARRAGRWMSVTSSA